MESEDRKTCIEGGADGLYDVARIRPLNPAMLDGRIAGVSERFSVDVERRRRDFPVQRNGINLRLIGRLVRRIEFVRSLVRQFRPRGVAHKLLPAGQFHKHAGERRFVLRDKLDIRGIRRVAGVHRTLPAVQSSRRVRLIQRDRNRLGFGPAPVGRIELLLPPLPTLVSA